MSTVRQTSSQNLPVEYHDMNAIAAFSRNLIKREQLRSGGCAETAMQRVARRIKTGPGTLGNIVRNRVKSVCFSLGNRIIAAAISDIENERKKLENEHVCLLAMGASPDATALAEIEAGFEIVDRALARMRSGR